MSTCFILELTLILFFFGVKKHFQKTKNSVLIPEQMQFSTPKFRVKEDKTLFLLGYEKTSLYFPSRDAFGLFRHVGTP